MYLQTDGPKRPVTHVIVEPGSADLKALPEAIGDAALVTADWLVTTLERGEVQPEQPYAVEREPGGTPAASS